MNNSLNKITPNAKYGMDYESLSHSMSKLCINSENLKLGNPINEKGIGLSKKFEEKIDKNENLDDDDPHELEIVLWNKTKTKKLVNFVCSTGMKRILRSKNENFFENLKHKKKLKMKKNVKEVGKVKIKIFEQENGEKSFEFIFDTRDSSTVHSEKKSANQEINWKGGKHDLNFKINLNQLPRKVNKDTNFKIPNLGKENFPGVALPPTTNQLQTPSPKSSSTSNEFWKLKLLSYLYFLLIFRL